jgi:antitoxin component YwqK of YwqJK toxin-antitoxin module
MGIFDFLQNHVENLDLKKIRKEYPEFDQNSKNVYDINNTYDNLSDGLKYLKSTNMNVDGIVYTLYGNGFCKLRTEITYKQGVIYRMKWWYENGKLKSDTEYKDGKDLNGLVKEWWENGRLMREVLWDDEDIVSGEYWDKYGNKVDYI